MSAENPIVLIGAGKMGGAMLAGWLQQRPADHFHVVDPKLSDDIHALLTDHGVPFSKDLPQDLSPSVVIIAVKPQMMAEVLPSLARLSAAKPAYVSIAAGTTVATFVNALGSDAAVIRAMPNTPAQVGRGITVGYANGHVNEDQKKVVAELLAVTGAYDWVEEEALIDSVTAVSGSGPAYLFHMVEAMAAAGEEVGLTSELALKLARATVEGAGELLYQSEDLDAGTLRQNVTSPGGTTAAALSVLMADDGLSALMRKAVQAAKDRAVELGR